ncbi:CPBP family intramembrane glutamic endopeptidase [Mesonia maritima]|nr:type II CAAX endopeptidase family protein [Mesonia maritima]
MSIFKAILLTFLFILIFSTFQIITLLPFKDFLSSNPDLAEHLFGIITILGFLISYSIIFYFFWKPKLFDFKEETLKYLKPINFIYLFFIAFGLELFDRVLFDLDKLKDFYFNEESLIDFPDYYAINISNIYQAVSAILIAPIFEELFFRKYILGKLLLRNSKIIALITSSLCFSLIHIETPNNLLPTFIFGIISGFIFIETKKIIYSILLHFFMNSFWLALLLYGENYFNWIYQLNFNFIYWSLPLVGIILGSFGIYKITTANNAYHK